MNEQQRYEAFIAGLTDLSRQYGISINTAGGVTIADNANDFAEIKYIADASSGDLWVREAN